MITTFQAIVYAVIQGFSEFLPVSARAHQLAVPYLLNWPAPPEALLAAISIGALMAALVFFIHDWASMISSLLRVLLYRKKPMTLDERMPLFILLTAIPLALSWHPIEMRLNALEWSPLLISGSLAIFALPLWFSDSFSRKNRAIYDWNALDATWVGIFQIGTLLPGLGRTTGALMSGLLRNYRRDAAAKFTFYAAVPMLAASASLHLRGVQHGVGAPSPEVSWLSFWVALIVAFLSGLLAIGGLMKHLQSKGVGQYIAYRFILAATLAAVFWLRNRAA